MSVLFQILWIGHFTVANFLFNQRSRQLLFLPFVPLLGPSFGLPCPISLAPNCCPQMVLPRLSIVALRWCSSGFHCCSQMVLPRLSIIALRWCSSGFSCCPQMVLPWLPLLLEKGGRMVANTAFLRVGYRHTMDCKPFLEFVKRLVFKGVFVDFWCIRTLHHSCNRHFVAVQR